MTAANNLDVKKVGNKFRVGWTEEGPSILSVIRWFCCTKNNSNVPDERELDKILPVLPIEPNKLAAPPDGKIQVMWIGHSTVLVQFDGITLLTDPVFKFNCGRCCGFGRIRPSSCIVIDLPRVDAVLISHSHGDHFHEKSVSCLNVKYPDIHWYVATGLKDSLTKLGCKNVHELAWWQEEKHTYHQQQFDFICTPAQHWGGKPRLWCSWVVKGPKKRFYFAGDTGYFKPLFKKIGDDYGPFDLAALPIGAYEPRFATQFQHVDPAEAVAIHCDIQSKNSIAIHWGTMVLTYEFYLEPPQKVVSEMKAVGKDAENFQCLNLGEIWQVGDLRPVPGFMNVRIPSPRECCCCIC